MLLRPYDSSPAPDNWEWRVSFVERFVLLFGQHRILEERARAPAVWVTLNDQHALARTDVTNGLTRLGEIWKALAALEVALQVGVFNV